MKEQFLLWLGNKSTLSPTTVKKYASGTFVVSQEMLDLGVIPKPLASMTPYELDIAIGIILRNEQFIEKNKRGNHMYSNSIKQFRFFRLDTCEIHEDDSWVKPETTTESDQLTKARIGQGLYRKNIMEKYEGKCVITGIDMPKLLVASHIKPWAVCDDEERIDRENGFLLSASMDRLFDSGLMSFKKDGKMMISSFVGKENQTKLSISKDTVIDLKPTKQLLEYLEYHRDVLFVK